jgi:hypothetical protein
MRLAVVADSDAAALHGLEGEYEWGLARTFAAGAEADVRAWAPSTVFGVDVEPPEGPWRQIGLGSEGVPRRVSTALSGVWRRAPLPAADALTELRGRPGAGVLVAGGDEASRASAVAKLLPRRLDAWGAERLTRADLERASVVALLGAYGEPMPPEAPAVLAAGRVLLAPQVEPAFGLQPWSDHLPYENEDDLVRTADAAQTYPAAFEPIVAMGVLAAEAHLASAVYHRLAVDAELEDAASELFGDAGSGAIEDAPADHDDGRRDRDRHQHPGAAARRGRR